MKGKRLKELNEKYGKFLSGTLIGIIIMVISPIIVDNVYDKYVEKKEKDKIYEEMRIGNNKANIEDVVGFSKYIHVDEESGIEESIYTPSGFCYRCYYKDNQLIAYFVTVMDFEHNAICKFPDRYLEIVNNKKLGEFSYYEVNGKPNLVTSYVTNGIGRTLYCEEYYYNAIGNYRTFYFMDIDYGIVNTEYTNDESKIYDDEISSDNLQQYNYDIVLARDRKNSFPNTYGICIPTYSDIVKDMIMYYGEFDFDREQL